MFRVDPVSSDLHIELDESNVVSFRENQGPTPIIPDSFQLSSEAGSQLNSATVRIENIQDGNLETLTVDEITADNIRSTYHHGTGILRLSGIDSLENYRSVLQTLRYDHRSENPTGADRSISLSITDEGVASTKSFIDVSINAVNDALTITAIDDVEFSIGQQLSLAVMASDPEGSSLEFGLEFDGSAVQQGETPPAISDDGLIRWIAVRPGRIEITIKATDSDGLQSSTDFLVDVRFEAPGKSVPVDFAPFSGRRQLSDVKPDLRNGI